MGLLPIETMGMSTDDEETREKVNRCIVNGEMIKLAQFWAKGIEIDWGILYGAEKPRRLSLPTYPFAKERCWFSLNNKKLDNNNVELLHLHPLVHSDVSDLETQKFRSTFTGNEFFLEGHKVDGYKMLPGVALLEMAKVAGELSCGDKVIKIKNVVWIKPVITGDDLTVVNVSIKPGIGYLMYSITTLKNDKEIIVHN